MQIQEGLEEGLTVKYMWNTLGQVRWLAVDYLPLMIQCVGCTDILF